MEIVHLRNQAFYHLVIPNCNTKDKTLTNNISKVTCEACFKSKEGQILEAERIRNSF